MDMAVGDRGSMSHTDKEAETVVEDTEIVGAKETVVEDGSNQGK